MYIPQSQLKLIDSVKNKVIIIYGPRRVGKTTLLKKYLENKKNYLFLTGEDIYVQQALSSNSIEKLKSYLGQTTLLVIDEAQYIPNIGLNLKLIADHLSHIRVIASGSSTFNLLQNIGEPLTGRHKTIYIYPISQIELMPILTVQQVHSSLEERLIYGSYPELFHIEGEKDKQSYLRELVSSYLLKDILAYEGLKKSQKIIDLLILLAYQVGKEVSLTELASKLALNRNTIEKYLNLLQEVFILENIRGFSRNLRKEVTKTSRYYFYDNGIRNALINNFNPVYLRNDIGELWENYLVYERLKKQQYQPLFSNNYFWRTYDQKEIDWVEEREGKLFSYEFKWNKEILYPPKDWKEAYPNSSFECITPNNYFKFIT